VGAKLDIAELVGLIQIALGTSALSVAGVVFFLDRASKTSVKLLARLYYICAILSVIALTSSTGTSVWFYWILLERPNLIGQLALKGLSAVWNSPYAWLGIALAVVNAAVNLWAWGYLCYVLLSESASEQECQEAQSRTRKTASSRRPKL
jgi:hypothetical protein